ncbi:MAG TPA: M23 family metallopeptidase [Thermoanaerobaculia bacterium]|jgi:murein DD-endopeptidase MepM/ murein hydrolase activator NlpD|nr:M23 family metallopeptidase [Thermoanaerobaculia bacterium]
MTRPAAAVAAPLAPDATGAGRRRARGLEIQIHPADIRRRVVYLFAGRAELTLWSLAGLVYALFLILALAFTPGVVKGLLSSQEYQGMAAERARQGERLQALVGRLAQLAQRSRGLGLEAAKVRLAYGLGNPLAPPASASPASASPALPRPLAPAAPDSIYADAMEQGDRLRGRMTGDLALLDTRLAEVESFERAHPGLAATTPASCPLKGRFVLISSFARRQSPFTHTPEFHPGLDLAAPVGTPVHAPADGTVVFAGQLPPGYAGHGGPWWRLGNLVLIRDGDLFYTAFGHLAEIRVRRGERLRRGAVVGTVGNSGWSTSPHLHYEIRRASGVGGEYRPVDPRIYILDHRWPNEERLLLGAGSGPRPGEYDPMPAR